MKIQRNVEVPKNIGRGKLGEVSLMVKPTCFVALVEFYESEDANMKFECESKEEANIVHSTLAGRVKATNLPVKVMRSANDIYVVRKEK